MANFDKLRELAKEAQEGPVNRDLDTRTALEIWNQIEHFVGLIERIATALEVQAETRPREDA